MWENDIFESLIIIMIKFIVLIIMVLYFYLEIIKKTNEFDYFLVFNACFGINSIKNLFKNN